MFAGTIKLDPKKYGKELQSTDATELLNRIPEYAKRDGAELLNKFTERFNVVTDNGKNPEKFIPLDNVKQVLDMLPSPEGQKPLTKDKENPIMMNERDSDSDSSDETEEEDSDSGDDRRRGKLDPQNDDRIYHKQLKKE